ncbi:hypothetical protein PIB30_049850 [Stylosanthes scabra]|uniref:Importin-7/11-like TPR repeats domain-containing protein n=1 Tax=Stylosanthes scabra TaxID=79078 RepID=A0ABU6ZG67_9FABA|nr:hypothetical protein [Stylosanthes scabra]
MPKHKFTTIFLFPTTETDIADRNGKIEKAYPKEEGKYVFQGFKSLLMNNEESREDLLWLPFRQILMDRSSWKKKLSCLAILYLTCMMNHRMLHEILEQFVNQSFSFTKRMVGGRLSWFIMFQVSICMKCWMQHKVAPIGDILKCKLYLSWRIYQPAATSFGLCTIEASDPQCRSAVKRVLKLKLIVICLSDGDNRDPSKTSVKASSAAILARLLVMNTNSLAQLASEPSTCLLLQITSIPVQENILLCLIDIWFDKVCNVSSIQKKTIGLALSIILTLRLPQVIDKLDQIFEYHKAPTILFQSLKVKVDGGTSDEREAYNTVFKASASGFECSNVLIIREKLQARSGKCKKDEILEQTSFSFVSLSFMSSFVSIK